MSKPKYLKLLAVVEEDYEPVVGRITEENGLYHCENVMSIKLNENFDRPKVSDKRFSVDTFIDSVLDLAKERSNE